MPKEKSKDASKNSTSKVINKTRVRYDTISSIIKNLKSDNFLSLELYEKLEITRVARNKIAHGDYKYQPSMDDSALAIISALELLALSDDIHLAPNLSLQITCIN